MVRAEVKKASRQEALAPPVVARVKALPDLLVEGRCPDVQGFKHAQIPEK